MSSGILVIDKPAGWTSHDVVAKLRGVLRQRRIGHGGTLDPMATGVLVVFVGRATRAVPYLPGDKTYLARFRTGFTTDTLDITGTVTGESGRQASEREVASVLPSFVGSIEQLPPMVSAVKLNGRPLYKLARQGIEVERKKRRVHIESIEYLGLERDEHTIRVRCSAGTYIRTLADDIGRLLGCGACLSSLRRERSGPFSLEDAVPVEDAQAAGLRPVDLLFQAYDRCCVGADEERALRHGNPVPAGGHRDGQLLRVYSADGEFLLLGAVKKGMLTVEKGFFEVTA